MTQRRIHNSPHLLLFSVLYFLLSVFLVPLAAYAQDTGTTDPGTTSPPVPDLTSAQYQFQNEGIFGCNQVAGANASAGTLSAIGGVYVPVNDAAVTLNTGILVYKECVLRPLQNRLRESAVSALVKKNYVSIQTGREGNAQHVVNKTAEEGIIADEKALTVLTDGTYDVVNPAFKEDVVRAVAINYQSKTRTNKHLECDYEGDLRANLEGRPANIWEGILAVSKPACNPLNAYLLAEQELSSQVGQALSDQRAEWDWGRGFYAVTDIGQDPLAEQVLTPASVVQESFQQIIGSPVRQLESANDIGQMVGALFAGITTQALSDTGGLAGLAQGVAGQPSYIDQVARESSQGVVGAAVNAAIQILNASRQIETRFLNAMNAIATSITQAIQQIRATEQACWNLIIPEAQSYAQCPGTVSTQNGGTRCAPAFNIQVATSTVFSQQVIDSQITPLAQVAIQNIENSERALGLIDQLIAGVTNTNSLNAQRLALQQLDNLVAQGALHTPFDATNAEQQRDDISAAMTGLVEDTARGWGDSPDPNIGWCNTNNSDIPRIWAERWRI